MNKILSLFSSARTPKSQPVHQQAAAQTQPAPRTERPAEPQDSVHMSDEAQEQTEFGQQQQTFTPEQIEQLQNISRRSETIGHIMDFELEHAEGGLSNQEIRELNRYIRQQGFPDLLLPLPVVASPRFGPS